MCSGEGCEKEGTTLCEVQREPWWSVGREGSDSCERCGGAEPNSVDNVPLVGWLHSLANKATAKGARYVAKA